jgi:hypothetical protein
MKDAIGGIIAFLLTIGVITDYGIGVVHSFQKHGVVDGIAGSVLFPWAMYRGVEFWWHDDFADVNWDKRLPKDMKNCIYFFMKSEDPGSNAYQVNEDLEKFSTKINKYPEDKKKYIQEGCNAYIKYANLTMTEFKSYIEKQTYQSPTEFSHSAELLQLKNKLLEYDFKEEIDMTDLAIEKLTSKIHTNLKVSDSEDVFEAKKADYLKVIELAASNQNNVYKKVYKELFNVNFLDASNIK